MTKSISLQKEGPHQERVARNHQVLGAPGERNRSPGGKKGKGHPFLQERPRKIAKVRYDSGEKNLT
jgi:hypothetical protein